MEKASLTQQCVFGLVPGHDNTYGTGFASGSARRHRKLVGARCSSLCAKASAESSCQRVECSCPPARVKEVSCECLGGIQVWIIRCCAGGAVLPCVARVSVVVAAGSSIPGFTSSSQARVSNTTHSCSADRQAGARGLWQAAPAPITDPSHCLHLASSLGNRMAEDSTMLPFSSREALAL